MGWTESELKGNSLAYIEALGDALKKKNQEYERQNKKR